MHIECVCQTGQRADRDITASRLAPTNVGSVEIGTLSQLLLRHASCEARRPKTTTERHAGFIPPRAVAPSCVMTSNHGVSTRRC